MIERFAINDHTPLLGYDNLRKPADQNDVAIHPKNKAFAPNSAYDEYFKIHKVFVGESGGAELERIAENLKQEWLPRYLDAAGWAFAESALTQSSKPNVDRTHLVQQATQCWERALVSQHEFDNEEHREWLSDHVDSYRLALNLAYIPLMHSIIAGNVTESTRERTFADTMAIAQLSVVQGELASRTNDIGGVADHRGFQYECNALLSLLYLNNPNYVPLPSSARAGSGYDYRDQTHDISVIHQRWGKIHRITPIEIKSAASLRDRQRYKALIVRGKMHLSVEGRYDPKETLNAFASIYEGTASADDQRIATHASSTMHDLLVLYQKGNEVESFKKIHSNTTFHTVDHVAKKYRELSPYPRTK
jgi:hypothetical protein